MTTYKTIALAGLGVEGRGSLDYFHAKFPQAEITVFDENPNCKLPDTARDFAKFGGDVSLIHDFDLVLRSPMIAPRKIPADNAELSSSTKYFFAHCPAPIIGVTGSKGKGTTCSFIASMLEKFFAINEPSRRVFLLGNIGIPALSKLDQIAARDVVVYEMSSFQLWDLAQSPHIGVFTMLEPDHLNVHADFNDYATAKSHVFAYQKPEDFAIFNAANKLISDFANSAKSIKIPFNSPENSFVYFDDQNFYLREQKICSIGDVKLPGQHNLRNAAAAIDAVLALLVPEFLLGQNKLKAAEFAKITAAISDGLRNFHGLPHRLKFVRELHGIKFYDDSIATTPGSTIAAINSFTAPKIILLGGSDKGADYSGLAEEIARHNRENRDVKTLVIYGAMREKMTREIANEFAKLTKRESFLIPEIITINTEAEQKTFAEIQVGATKKYEPFANIFAKFLPKAQAGDVVILSPAAASFDMFKSYSDRGEQFVAAVQGLK